MKRKADAPAAPSAARRSANGKAAPDDRELTIDELIIDDEEPVENFFIEKERRLLTDALNAGWRGPGRGRSFIAASDVGVFPEKKQTPIVPDVLLSLDVPAPLDPSRKEHRSYFLWIMGKPPDVVFEFVSDRRGGEEGHKKKRYAQIGVRYYVIFDPERWLRGDVLAFLRTARRRPLSCTDGALVPGGRPRREIVARELRKVGQGVAPLVRRQRAGRPDGSRAGR